MARSAMSGSSGGGFVSKAVFFIVALTVIGMILKQPVEAGDFVRSASTWTEGALGSLGEFVRTAVPQGQEG